MKIAGLVALLTVAAGCGHTPSPPPSAPTEVTPRSSTGGIEVTVRAPARAVWTASTLGPSKPALRVIVTNRSAEPVDVSNLRIHLEATREGTMFRCNENAGPDPTAREPSSVGPGGSLTFDRTVDCALPLTGSYAVRVAVSFGNGEWRRPRDVQSFALDVAAFGREEPRPFAPVPGLWAALGASPSIGGETRMGYGRIAILLVNGTNNPIAAPPLKLALSVYRAGTSIPCEDEPVPVLVPAVLGSGESHRQSLEVSCLGLTTTGTFEVVGRLVAGDEAVEIGRLRIRVSHDPALHNTPSTGAGFRPGRR